MNYQISRSDLEIILTHDELISDFAFKNLLQGFIPDRKEENELDLLTI